RTARSGGAAGDRGGAGPPQSLVQAGGRLGRDAGRAAAPWVPDRRGLQRRRARARTPRRGGPLAAPGVRVGFGGGGFREARRADLPRCDVPLGASGGGLRLRRGYLRDRRGRGGGGRPAPDPDRRGTGCRAGGACPRPPVFTHPLLCLGIESHRPPVLRGSSERRRSRWPDGPPTAASPARSSTPFGTRQGDSRTSRPTSARTARTWRERAKRKKPRPPRKNRAALTPPPTPAEGGSPMPIF